jgi:hypothetical protein
VATAFAYRNPRGGPFDARLGRLLAIYAWLRRTYAEILAQRLMALCIEAFRDTFPEQGREIPDVKILDSLFWSAGTLLRQGRLTHAPNRVFSAR